MRDWRRLVRLLMREEWQRLMFDTLRTQLLTKVQVMEPPQTVVLTDTVRAHNTTKCDARPAAKAEPSGACGGVGTSMRRGVAATRCRCCRGGERIREMDGYATTVLQ